MHQVYLELIQLTELYLLQKLPPIKKAKLSDPNEERMAKAMRAEVDRSPDEIVKVAALAPKVPLKVPPIVPIQPLSPKAVQVEETEPIPEPVHNNPAEILNLIKTHCPKLKLIEKPPKEKTVFLLLAPKSPAETQVATSLAVALNKEGFEIVKDLDKASLFIAERECLLQHPQKSAIKRDTSGKLALGKSAVLVIGSLAELIAHPEKKRGLWTEVLSLK